MEKTTVMENEIFENYHKTFYEELHGWRDYELTSQGYGEWYYDLLPDDKKNKVLDIGCGDGKFLFFLQQKGYKNIEGLEISPQQAEEAKKHINCPIHLVEKSNLFLEKFIKEYHMITMNDVLEHIPKKETVKFLKAAHDAIIPGGIAVVNVPQVSGFTSMFCRYNDFTHETIFTEMSLKQVLLSAGFSDVKFIKQKWPIKWSPRHLVYRFVKLLWNLILKCIYIIESPGEKHPSSFQCRLVAVATRSLNINYPSSK
jgi:2-polyprenyl-3-methyl-5-hydroxy-6-metoxy-1,4-benzoquinol methylase